ncbi:IS3 family transposase [Garciella nitratireducens]|uniref:IS3 family transposase n=1 Tax=Garciella nitratireducens TaxID=218205 RepID=UPI000B3F5C62
MLLLRISIAKRYKYYDFNVAYKAIFEYIKSWYNRKRIHSSIDYRTPQEVYEAALVAA